MGMDLRLMVIDRFLPSCLLRFFASRRWTTLDNNTTLVLGFARIGEDLRLEERDVAIKLLELCRKGVRLGFVARLVIKYGWGRGGTIGGAGRERETGRYERRCVGRGGRHGGVIARGLWRLFPRLCCGERDGVVFPRVKELPVLRCVAMSRGLCRGSRSVRAASGFGRRLGLSCGPTHGDRICVGIKQLPLVFVRRCVRGGLLGGRKLEGSRELDGVRLGSDYMRWRRLP